MTLAYQQQLIKACNTKVNMQRVNVFMQMLTERRDAPMSNTVVSGFNCCNLTI